MTTITRRVPYVEYYKKEGLNLYPILEKRPAQYVNGTLVGLTGWDTLTDFSTVTEQVKENTNFGFRTGKQFKSGKTLIVLDFDIISSNGKDSKTQELYDRYEELDTGNKLGFYKSSTCGNYGVIVDITNNEELLEKIEEISAIKANKIQVEHLEILYNSNAVLPPSKTSCKEHQKIHKSREFINLTRGFCIPNVEQSSLIIECITRYQSKQKRTRLEHTPNIMIDPSIASNNLIVTRISTGRMLGILDCLKESRFLDKYDKWINLLYMVANGNNTDEVITKFWERCKTGKYSTVTLEHIKQFFLYCDIEPEFDNRPLWFFAKSDNPTLYNKTFNQYDEPNFEYNTITFINDENENTKYINYNQTIDYFKTNKENNPDEVTKYNIICSGLGTGKTKFIEKRIKAVCETNSKAKIIFITMRQTLSYSLMESFAPLGFKNYLESSVSYFTSKLIISLDSILKVTKTIDEILKIPKYDIVICDEIASLLSHFSYQNIQNIDEVYNTFTDIIKNSKECYFMDGDISNREVLWLRQYMEYNTTIHKLPLFNALKSTKFDIIGSYCSSEVYCKMLKDLDDGKNICYVSMSAEEAQKVYNLISQKYKTFLIISKTGDKQKSDLKCINALVQHYRCFIYSPSITVGVDINVQHFDNIYGYVCEGSVCPRDYFQMLARVRNPSCHIINIIIGNFKMEFKGLYNVIPFNSYKKSIYGNEQISGLNYIKLWNKWEYDHKSLWLDVFKWYAIKKGHQLSIKPSTQEQFENGKTNFIEIVERLNLNRNILPVTVEEVYNATILYKYKLNSIPDKITNEERDRISAKEILTDEDKQILQRIDRVNGWDNVTVMQERIRKNIANSHDKARMEKTIYSNVFGINNSTSIEEFKEVYNNIDTVINNVRLNNLRGIEDLLVIAPIEYRTFDELLISKKTGFIRKLQNILNITDFTDGIKMDNIDYNQLQNFVKDVNMQVAFGIVDIEKGSKILKEKPDSTNKKNMNVVKKLLGDYGYHIKSKRERININRKYVYELTVNKAVDKYKKQLESYEPQYEI